MSRYEWLECGVVCWAGDHLPSSTIAEFLKSYSENEPGDGAPSIYDNDTERFLDVSEVEALSDLERIAAEVQ